MRPEEFRTQLALKRHEMGELGDVKGPWSDDDERFSELAEEAQKSFLGEGVEASDLPRR